MTEEERKLLAKDIVAELSDRNKLDGIDGTDFMCLCRCEALPEGITVLGTYDEVFADAELKAVYDRIYPPTYSYSDESGEMITVVKPEKFGVFA